MKTNKIAILTTLFLMTGANLTAQDTVTMNLKECMRYAVEHSTKMRIQQADNRDAQINRRDAILAAFTPSIDAGSSASLSFGRSVDPETNTYIQTTSFANGFSASASMVVFNGFQAVNNLRITKTAQQMGLTKAQQIEDQICLATMEAYCNVLYYTEMQKALKAQVATAEKAVQLATKQEKLGQKSHADVVQVQSDLAERQYLLTQCRNHLNDALITLKDVMFWPIEEPLKIDGVTVGLSQFPLSKGAGGFGSPTDQAEKVSQMVEICQNQYAVRPFGRGHDEERPPRPQDGPLAVAAETRGGWRLVVEFLHLSGNGGVCFCAVFRPVEEQRRRVCATLVEHPHLRPPLETFQHRAEEERLRPCPSRLRAGHPNGGGRGAPRHRRPRRQCRCPSPSRHPSRIARGGF